MANIDRAFTVPSLSLNDESGIFLGEIDPSSSGFEAPESSLFIRKNPAQLFQKSGPADTEWERIETSDVALDKEEHRALDTLVHAIAENNHTEYIRTGGRVTAVIVWTDVTKTFKLREELITYVSGQVSQTVNRQYDGAGNLLEILTTVITRTGGVITSEDVTLIEV